MGQTAFITASAAPSPDYLLGLDEAGHWIARDARGLTGGIFVDRDAAVRFAAHETEHRPNAVRVVPDAVRLSLTGALPRL